METKILKFRPYLIQLILNGSKNITWRLFDDKNIQEGDLVNLVNWETGEEFGKAKITCVKETTFGNLTEEDKIGHETFKGDEEMYRTYSTYYKVKITKDTALKIIWFELTQQVK